MSDGTATDYAVALAAAALGVGLAWRRRSYAPVAGLLLFGTGTDLARRALAVSLIRPAKAALRVAGLDPNVDPLHGLPLAALQIHRALFVAWPLAIVAVVVFVFQRRRPWWVIGVWGAVVATLVLGYRRFFVGEAAQLIFTPVEFGSLVVAVGMLVAWTWRKRSPSAENGALLLIVSIETVVGLTFPGSPFAQWALAQDCYRALYSILCVVQGGVLCWPSGSQSSSSSR